VSALAEAEPLDVVTETSRAATLLHPLRMQLLEWLAEPDSATGLARRLGRPRQTINYHLRELERAGLVRLVEARRKGNVAERVLQATARSYVIDPRALGPVAARPETLRDRFSAAYLVAVAAQVIRDVAVLRARAAEAGKRLATFTLEAEVSFASARDRRAFMEELATTVAGLAVKYGDERAPGRRFRVVVGAHPAVPAEET